MCGDLSPRKLGGEERRPRERVVCPVSLILEIKKLFTHLVKMKTKLPPISFIPGALNFPLFLKRIIYFHSKNKKLNLPGIKLIGDHDE
jgi:hypothetical protein